MYKSARDNAGKLLKAAHKATDTRVGEDLPQKLLQVCFYSACWSMRSFYKSEHSKSCKILPERISFLN